MLTAMFGVVKGETEAELLALPAEKSCENLKVYNVRPAAVDSSQHAEIKEFVPQRTGFLKLVEMGFSPVVRAVGRNLYTPTREMGKVVTELMLGNGEKLEGSGVIEGRTLSNIGLRRMGGW